MLRLAPAPPLDLCVEFLWASERPALPHARERSLPTGRADLVIALRQTHLVRYAEAADPVAQRFRIGVLQGSCDRYVVRGGTDEPSSVVGVHFRPGGAALLLGLPMGEVANRTIGLQDLWGAAADRLHERLLDARSQAERLRCLERGLLDRLLRQASPPGIDQGLAWALRQFDADPALARVEPVRASLGWSAQRFIRHFRDGVGLTPKRYCRVRRFQEALQRAAAGGKVNWAAVALDAGYSDQPHLVHEFRRFAGVSPSDYRPVAPGLINHLALA